MTTNLAVRRKPPKFLKKLRSSKHPSVFFLSFPPRLLTSKVFNTMGVKVLDTGDIFASTHKLISEALEWETGAAAELPTHPFEFLKHFIPLLVSFSSPSVFLLADQRLVLVCVRTRRKQGDPGLRSCPTASFLGRRRLVNYRRRRRTISPLQEAENPHQGNHGPSSSFSRQTLLPAHFLARSRYQGLPWRHL